MAKNTNPFAIAHAQKEVLTKQTEKRIQYVYKKSAEDIEKRLKNLEIINPSDHTKKIYFEGLLSDINGAQKDFNAQIFDIIVDAGEKSGFIAIDAGNKLMQGYGLTIQGAYSHIPRKEVENIVSGKLYGDKWSLSQSIWKSSLRTKSDIEKVVAQGLAENKSVKDIADALTKYVDPTARKPWDWSKVYPGTAQKVDYNAQRLARTMIQHSYQTSMVQSQLSNPFCKGIIWHSVGLHGRTCEMCEEMDGQTFPVDQLPLDHPNGMCYFEPSLEDMDTVADRLADWVNGGADPELDEYVSKAFNTEVDSATGKAAINGVKGEAEVGHKVVEGTDISGTWERRPEQFAYEIEDVFNAQGFDGLPRVVSQEEFDRFVQESNFIAQRAYTAETQELLEEYRKMLYEGKWYVDCSKGGSAYGQGMYCDGRFGTYVSDRMKHTMSAYGGTSSNGFVETFTLTKDAKIVNYNEIDSLRHQIGRERLNSLLASHKYTAEEKEYIYAKLGFSNNNQKYEVSKWAVSNQEKVKAIGENFIGRNLEEISRIQVEMLRLDEGSVAALSGFDAINCNTVSDSEGYFVILNRTKVIFNSP